MRRRQFITLVTSIDARADDRPSFSIPAATRWSASHLASDVVVSQDRVRDLVPRGHDQRRLALLVHTAEPTCVGKQLTLLPVTDAGGLAYLHRHTAAWAEVAIAGNYNGFSS
jgi:hypothetical protein